MPRMKVTSEQRVAELALQVGRAAYGESSAAGLTPAQWMALRFFGRANRFSRTVSAFAGFHATTRGTASQTVKSLVQRGYLTRTRSVRDGRSTTFNLTEKARRQLAADPFEAVVRAAQHLSPAQRDRTASGLRGILQQLAVERDRPAPALCNLCGHLAVNGSSGYVCRLMSEPLTATEIEQLCIHCTRCRAA
ncbi:MAG: MarR family transcriptional regulator [Gammaproteobacteria bacterium]|nr:MarR family transcriptional regulator [Gammaproteobacteria bacterium]